MAFLVIVKRDEEPLFNYLLEHFQEPEVTVLMDRRQTERRRTERRAAAERQQAERRRAAAERRQVDRRSAPSEGDPLWKYGFRVAVSQS